MVGRLRHSSNVSIAILSFSKPIIIGDSVAAFFKIGKRDLAYKPMRRRLKGRIEGHLSISLAASAVEHELSRLLAASGTSISLADVRTAARTRRL